MKRIAGRWTILLAIALMGFVLMFWLREPAPVGNTAVLPAVGVERDFYDWQDRHERVLALIREQPVDLVFIGDSITHLFGGRPEAPIVRGAAVWDEFYGERRVANLGFGWDRTQNVLWRLEHGELDGIAPKVAVVLIGTNNLTGTSKVRTNTPEETAAGIEAVCRAIHGLAPECRIVLMGVLPRREPELAEPIDRINALISRLDVEEFVTYLDLGPRLAGPDGLALPEFMQDDVHPTLAGYRLWAEAIEPTLAELLVPTSSR